MKFTNEQLEVIQYKDSNLLVTAAPGAGKTQVFTSRIAYLIKYHNVLPENILALTYTSNAAEQMRKRLSTLIGTELASRVTMLTFHSFAIRNLKKLLPQKYADKKITPDWFRTRTLYDIAGERTFNNPEGLGLAIRGNELGMFVSYQKSNLIQPGDQVIMDSKAHPFIVKESVSRLSEAYEVYCRLIYNSNTLDFDDMLLEFAMNLENDSDFLEKIQDKYKFIQVDEFQDTNSINTHILKLINGSNLMVVGDVNQSIYSFINADVNEFLNFDKTFPDVKTIRLDKNFRSTQNIVDITNKIALASPNKKLVELSGQTAARNEIGQPVKFQVFQTEADETQKIAEEVESLIQEGHSPGSIAIISRTNANLGLYESEFATKHIKVNNANGGSFFDKKEIADLLAYATHAMDKSDDMSLRKIFNSPNRFISKQSMNDLDTYASNNEMDIEEAIFSLDGGRSKKAMTNLVYLFESLRNKLDQNAASFLRTVYVQTKYEDYIYKTTKTAQDAANKIDSIEHLFTLASRFKTVAAFMTHISIIQNNRSVKEDAVNLLTVHGSKGLEFDFVFGVGVNAKSYPHDMSFNFEEERRLLYVCVSRAMNNLLLSSYVFDKGTSIENSPFMQDSFGSLVENCRKNVLFGAPFASIELK